MIEINGPEALERISRQIRGLAVGGIGREKSLKHELSDAIMKETAPLKAAIRLSAVDTLPRRGGLNMKIAKSRISARRRVTSRGEGVRIEARNAYAIDKIDQGHVRHPVYGHNVWVNQEVKSGFWTKPTEAIGPSVRIELERTLIRLAKRIG
jgi:hypothetical protein